MFIKTLIRQGEGLCEQKNEIKQLKEDNSMLQEELNYRIIKNNRYEKRNFDSVCSHFGVCLWLQYKTRHAHCERLSRVRIYMALVPR